MSIKDLIIEQIDINQIKLIHKTSVKETGFTPESLQSAGRCYDFAETFAKNLKKVGIKADQLDSRSYLRKVDSGKFKHKLTDEEYYNIDDDNHAWVHINGQHYDSLHPNGVNEPKKLKFYKR